jgi:hypothetical protein
MIGIDNPSRKIDVVPDMQRLCRVVLNGCESPITFQVDMLGEIGDDGQRPDLTIYLSTETREPSIEKNMKVADRLKKFKFFAPSKAQYFEDEASLYLSLESVKGCEVKIKVISCQMAEAMRKEGHQKLQNEPVPVVVNKKHKKSYNI